MTARATDRPALLFDLDGTLILSDMLHFEVFRDIFAEHGQHIDMAFYLGQIHGRFNADIFAQHLPGADGDALSDLKEARFRARLARAVPPMPGAPELLARAHARGWGTAVVTNAPRENAAAMLAAIGLEGAFDAVVIGAECARAKPDPAPYRAAMDSLGAAPARCIAFEDSPSGLRSARASGAVTIGLRSSLGGDALRAAGAQASIADFNDPALAAHLTRLTGAAA